MNAGSQANNPLDEHAWPRESDQLFAQRPKPQPEKSTGSPTFDSVLESMRPAPDYCCREGYYQAAQVLARELGESRYSGLYFPMVYCFRHYVELSLKSLIQVYSDLTDEEVKKKLQKQHGLMRLWNKAKQLIGKAGPRNRRDDDTLTNVERCITELNTVDESS